MGYSRSSIADYSTYASTTTLRKDGSRKDYSEIFTKSNIDSKYDPKNIKVRESLDSELNPESHAVIVGLDVTGSMGMISGEMANHGLGRLMTGLIDSKIISDPHLMFMAVGDVEYDFAPLQVTQFEADIKIGEQLQELYLEAGGGGNNYESYHLPWHFAATRTVTDCFDKRNKKGYLFTIGDERAPAKSFSSSEMVKVYSNGQGSLTPNELLNQAKERWEVFHIIVEQGSHARSYLTDVKRSWYSLLGNRTILLDDYTKVADVIVAVIAVSEGMSPEDAIKNATNAEKTVEHALFGMKNFNPQESSLLAYRNK